MKKILSALLFVTLLAGMFIAVEGRDSREQRILVQSSVKTTLLQNKNRRYEMRIDNPQNNANRDAGREDRRHRRHGRRHGRHRHRHQRRHERRM
jgi:hypothetical protein